jgi:hypothetical protein
VGRPDAGPGLRQGLEAVEHSAVAVRGMFRAVHDAMSDETWPEDEVGEAVLDVLRQVFSELADGVDAFGELVRAEARLDGGSVAPQVHRVQAGLDGLHEARARLDDLLLVDTPPVVHDLHASMQATVRRLLREMSLEERVRRQLRLLNRPARGRASQAPARHPPRHRPGPVEPAPDDGPDAPTQLL